MESANTGGAVGWCLEPHDLAGSKLVAGRDRDTRFVIVLLRESMVNPTVLRERVGDLALSGPLLDATRGRLEGLLKRTS